MISTWVQYTQASGWSGLRARIATTVILVEFLPKQIGQWVSSIQELSRLVEPISMAKIKDERTTALHWYRYAGIKRAIHVVINDG